MMYFMIAVGGAFGAMSRFALGKWISSYWNHAFPLATFSINVLGSFLMGVVFILITEKMAIPESYRPLLMVGFLGAFTTFSTFSLEIVSLINQQAWLSAVSYLLLSCLLGVLALAAGILIARLI
ncbi:fluoride efflux transporter CrcB [Marinomonas mediterranea]|uniref:Fluoride-specific ion channel FluC n=1 Tax=Marinomonas mediterranea (strain ATCC 700492 / JCM 21426 / NBRC 103028 / MMB-1) TaxID=717774 RepID=F2JWF0_MARM1|nr:fluoride efflux transporter CrcB [Marinomonas mediterranea]ADZ90623.1 CrcB-like protein [Marinomonas mediterranea MMB-1]WCN08665.1 fluoride efflux transporter CrcB [Marinomonas mediterranea]WCN12720.1 fluoride efflux transporter CrcB [Marinomonas mediterranea]WCN16793.1 fluoride efflux transporter CrcB [Marinomonas mediterranea MMB-1]